MNVYGVCEKAYRGVPLYAVCAKKERERAFEMKSVAIVPQEKHPFFLIYHIMTCLSTACDICVLVLIVFNKKFTYSLPVLPLSENSPAAKGILF